MSKRDVKRAHRAQHVVLCNSTRYVPTPDDFSPSFPDGTAEVRIYASTFGNDWIRMAVFVQGTDDTVMVREIYGGTDLERMRLLYDYWVREINGWAIVQKTSLLGLGFHFD